MAPHSLVAFSAFTLCSVAAANPQSNEEFESPYRIEAGGDLVRTEPPGHAAPCWYDINGDGHDDLIVGQFTDGKMKVYLGSESGLATGQWLLAGGKVAQVPGIS